MRFNGACAKREGKYSNHTEYMIKCLANEYRYVYDVKNVRKKKKQLTNEQPVETGRRKFLRVYI